MLTVRLLGAFEVIYKKRIVHIPGRMAQSLFAYLILNKDISHRREKLATMLWADSPGIAARENLRHTLWQIRKAFGELGNFETDDLSVRFTASPDLWLDVDTLKTAAQKNNADDLIPTLATYQGELLPGFYEDWVTLEREYLNYVFEHNMARLLAMFQAEKRWLDVLEWGERWLAFGQKPEPAYRALMLAHKEEGEMPKMAEIYARCLRDLGEIGLSPSEQTQGLFASLKQTSMTR